MSDTPGWGQSGGGSNWQQPGGAPPPPPNTPPPGYSTPPGYGYGGQQMYAREHPDGTTILVLGILSLVVCGLLGPFAWVKGNNALREIDANPGAYTNRSNVSAGRICGIIASVFLIIGVVFLVFALILGAAASTTG